MTSGGFSLLQGNKLYFIPDIQVQHPPSSLINTSSTPNYITVWVKFFDSGNNRVSPNVSSGGLSLKNTTNNIWKNDPPSYTGQFYAKFTDDAGDTITQVKFEFYSWSTGSNIHVITHNIGPINIIA